MRILTGIFYKKLKNKVFQQQVSSHWRDKLTERETISIVSIMKGG